MKRRTHRRQQGKPCQNIGSLVERPAKVNAHHTTQDKAHENFARAAHMSQGTSHPLIKGSHDRVDDASHESPNEKETDDGIDENWFQAFQRLRQTAYEFL